MRRRPWITSAGRRKSSSRATSRTASLGLFAAWSVFRRCGTNSLLSPHQVPKTSVRVAGFSTFFNAATTAGSGAYDSIRLFQTGTVSNSFVSSISPESPWCRATR